MPSTENPFDHLYRAHATRLRAFLVHRTGDAELAEDILADVFERALRASARYDPELGSESTWLFAITINHLRHQQRRLRYERRALERVAARPAGEQPDAHEKLANREEVADAMGVLSERERDTIALRFGADLTRAQVAAVLGEPTGTVDARVSRALKKLRLSMTAA